ncbi:nucleotidyltransferase [Corallococcus exiguus]|uniref:nucleotidyltransferase domain-containing protein n=1 Tax=Corallococcus TaxID=83461 RepID=UPI000F85B997|nr:MULTISPECIES: nucleotidyltransferase [Corallococcus]NRD53377.1 nucleotidyltransferase [Corallococcus exiguus]NRD62600.1 nucleotidyltransferase [Corallococcus exiguus]RUO92263.1 nucleotidyltransferase [Corallococcus sp. AB018]
MWSVRHAVEQFIQSLELTPGQREACNGQQTRLREVIQAGLGAQTTFLSGSYGRNTAIRPLHDIDIFVVLRDISLAAPGTGKPLADSQHELLLQVQGVLREKWENKAPPRIQRRSIKIEFSGTGLDFDVVPAFKLTGRDAFLIPERGTDRWIQTNPRLHAERCREADRVAGHMLNPLIKTVKKWNRQQQSSPLRSFHLEAMSYSAFRAPPTNGGKLETLKTLFEHLSTSVQRPCPDPAHLGEDVDAGMIATQRVAAQQLLSRAATQLGHVLREEKTDPAQAHSRLRQLFGNDYRDHD